MTLMHSFSGLPLELEISAIIYIIWGDRNLGEESNVDHTDFSGELIVGLLVSDILATNCSLPRPWWPACQDKWSTKGFLGLHVSDDNKWIGACESRLGKVDNLEVDQVAYSAECFGVWALVISPSLWLASKRDVDHIDVSLPGFSPPPPYHPASIFSYISKLGNMTLRFCGGAT
jgi:hypothetical protein